LRQDVLSVKLVVSSCPVSTRLRQDVLLHKVNFMLLLLLVCCCTCKVHYWSHIGISWFYQLL